MSALFIGDCYGDEFSRHGLPQECLKQSNNGGQCYLAALQATRAVRRLG